MKRKRVVIVLFCLVVLLLTTAMRTDEGQSVSRRTQTIQARENHTIFVTPRTNDEDMEPVRVLCCREVLPKLYPIETMIPYATDVPDPYPYP